MHFLTAEINALHAEALRAEARREAQARAARQGQPQRPSFSFHALFQRLFAAPVHPA
ncbi:hypothetical protein [Deinococcus sp. QL22]|uniref:hypothetical protein n=1 Tax=Deinococcus sp. QL22 TaxID=2939437 RepID=UPI0020179C15|nr:hypothetical protein [Deinococcus sp. QL22]UQN06039.1 hypothetical protein M1R55_14405 [Deinococcus sp. QL22]